MSSAHSSTPAPAPANNTRHEQTEAERRIALAEARVSEARAEVEIARLKREAEEAGLPQEPWRKPKPPPTGLSKWMWIFLPWGLMAAEIYWSLGNVGKSATAMEIAGMSVLMAITFFLCMVSVKTAFGLGAKRWPERAMGALIVLFIILLGTIGCYFLEEQFGTISKVSGWISSISVPSTSPAPAASVAPATPTSTPVASPKTTRGSSKKKAQKVEYDFCKDPAIAANMPLTCG